MKKWLFVAYKKHGQLGSPASQSISLLLLSPPPPPSFSSSSSFSSCHHRGSEGFREVKAVAAVMVAAAGVEDAAMAVVLGVGTVVVVEEDVGRRLSHRLLTCLGNHHSSPCLSRHLRDRRDSCQGSSSPGSRSRATPWTSCGSQPSSRSHLQVKSLSN
jgi:hypothetical protein